MCGFLIRFLLCPSVLTDFFHHVFLCELCFLILWKHIYGQFGNLQVLGAERLKVELQARGLKCGGTLQERAARLFLLKTTPLDKLPKKLLAKPPIGVIKKGAALSGKTHDIAVNS